jgi:hypothetical protein
MKKLNLVFIILFATIFFMTSCKKEGQEMTTTLQDTERITGETLPKTEGISSEEIDRIRQAKILSYTKESQKNSLETTEFNGVQTNARSRTITNIACGNTKYGTTRGETNTIDVYTGKSDKIYFLETNKRGEIEINLTHLQSDLDLFVFEAKQDNYGRKYIGRELHSSDNFDVNNENIKAELDRGTYYIIIETYKFESNFQLSVKCRGGNSTTKFCEDYQNLQASYSRGITEQSNHWKLWDNNANDALVLYEKQNSNNKVVKIDKQRFQHQDVVRELTGSTLSRGRYITEFDLYIPSSSRVDFLSEKTRYFGQKQGFAITINNGVLSVKNGGRSTFGSYQIPTNTWIKVLIDFNITNNKILVLVNRNSLIMMDASANLESCHGSKSIHGINFYTKASNSKFHIDNMCITEIEPNSDYPYNEDDSGSGVELLNLQCD